MRAERASVGHGKESRWFPERPGSPQKFERGWDISSAPRLVAYRIDGCVDLVSVNLDPVSGMELGFALGVERRVLRLRFRDVSDLEVDGELQYGRSSGGWEVAATDMLVADRPRGDGRLVYLLELAESLICFASLKAEVVEQGPGKVAF